MGDRLDKVLEAIDVGLQTAGDFAYATDNGLCVRCQTIEPPEGSSWCTYCAKDEEPPRPRTFGISTPTDSEDWVRGRLSPRGSGEDFWRWLGIRRDLEAQGLVIPAWESGWEARSAPVVAHYRGGPVNGNRFPLEEPVRARIVAYGGGLDGYETTVYRRRPADLHPAGFIQRTGGPARGHWIFDWERSDPPEEAYAQMVVSWDDARPDVVGFMMRAVAEAMADQLLRAGATMEDLEWECLPTDWRGEVLLRCEAIIG